MGQLPPIRRLLTEDFKDQIKWIGPLLTVLNTFFESVVGLMNNNVSIAGNTTGDIRTITLQDLTTQSIALRKPTIPKGVVAIGVQAVGGFAYTCSTPTLSWIMTDNKTLQISNITGLSPAPSASNMYVLTLYLIGG